MVQEVGILFFLYPSRSVKICKKLALAPARPNRAENEGTKLEKNQPATIRQENGAGDGGPVSHPNPAHFHRPFSSLRPIR